MNQDNRFNAKLDLVINPETILREAPSYATSEAAPGLSRRYTHVNTKVVVDILRGDGWDVTSARSIKPRKVESAPFARHVITMRRKCDIGAEFNRGVGEFIPEMKLENSHAGDCALLFHLGLFRTACSNGVVVGEASFNALRFVHLGLTQAAVIGAGQQMIEGFARLGGIVASMQRRLMGSKEVEEFAVKSMLLRYPTLDAAPIDPTEILAKRRAEDNGQSLWLVFNRAQENIINGGLMGNKRDARGRRRVMRQINSVRRQVSVNKGLWDLAAGYLLN